MAHHKSAIKRIKTSAEARLVNRQLRGKLRTLTKAVREASSKDEAQAALGRVVSYLDKMANKNIIHRNKASNQKSKLVRLVNGM
jgi:small subunit ribosomal protein S20